MIIIPMAGLSQRFAQAGYALPKYMLPLHGQSVFAHAVLSFRRYFDSERFLFVARPVENTRDFIRAQCEALGVKRFDIVMLDDVTAGQAETVEIGLGTAPDETPVTIFNIDTFRRDFATPTASWFAGSDGYLEVFAGSGANWSYVRPAAEGEALVAETAEKRAISELCCDGLYHFARAGDFRLALAAERKAMSAAELFVAPLYNHLIAAGRRIHFERVAESDLLFCGVPQEYEALALRDRLFSP